MARKTWIFEGGFSKTWDERAQRADTLIWLDVGLWRRLWRVTYRFFRYYGKSRPDLPDGCAEGNWGEMWDFYKWIWNTRDTARVKMAGMVETYSGSLDVIVMRTIPEVEAYLDAVRARAA